MAGVGLRHYLGSIQLARRVVRRDDWDVLFTDGPWHEGAVVALLDRRRRRRVMLDSTNGTVDLIRGGKGHLSRMLQRWELRHWNGFVAVSSRGETAIRSLTSGRADIARWTPTLLLGDPFGAVVARQDGPGVAIMHGDEGPGRVRYKGLDRVAEASRIERESGGEKITVYGRWRQAVKQQFENDVIFAGLGPPGQFLRGACYSLQPSRNEGFCVAVPEAMVAGVPPIVGELGAAYLVAQVEERLVIEDGQQAAAAISWLRRLPPEDYRSLCARLRRAGLEYLERSQSDDALHETRRVLAGE
jgi:glycosyltransferase involved in cell wall biosynthesis